MTYPSRTGAHAKPTALARARARARAALGDVDPSLDPAAYDPEGEGHEPADGEAGEYADYGVADMEAAWRRGGPAPESPPYGMRSPMMRRVIPENRACVAQPDVARRIGVARQPGEFHLPAASHIIRVHEPPMSPRPPADPASPMSPRSPRSRLSPATPVPPSHGLPAEPRSAPSGTQESIEHPTSRRFRREQEPGAGRVPEPRSRRQAREEEQLGGRWSTQRLPRARLPRPMLDGPSVQGAFWPAQTLTLIGQRLSAWYHRRGADVDVAGAGDTLDDDEVPYVRRRQFFTTAVAVIGGVALAGETYRLMGDVGTSPGTSDLVGPPAPAEPPQDPALLVGHGEIDAQHQLITELLDIVEDTMTFGQSRPAQAAALGELTACVKVHHAFEESLMDAYHLSGSAAHKAAHQAFLKQITDFCTRFDAGDANLTPDFIAGLRSRLAEHTAGEDAGLAAQLKAKGVRSAV